MTASAWRDLALALEQDSIDSSWLQSKLRLSAITSDREIEEFVRVSGGLDRSLVSSLAWSLWCEEWCEVIRVDDNREAQVWRVYCSEEAIDSDASLASLTADAICNELSLPQVKSLAALV